MYNCLQPWASPWGLALLAPTGGGDSLGHEGDELGLWKELTVRGLTAAPGGKRLEQHLLQEPGELEAARAAEGDGQSRDVSSQPSVGVLLSLHPLEGRDGCWMKCHGQAWGQRGLQLCHSGLVENALFPPSQGSSID